jgi:hypothetical protein
MDSGRAVLTAHPMRNQRIGTWRALDVTVMASR